MLAPTEVLVDSIPTAVDLFRESNGTKEEKVDSYMSNLLHDQLIVRGEYTAALDLFSQISAIRPVLPQGMTYTEYVDLVIDSNR
jgi:hypothetical protein